MKKVLLISAIVSILSFISCSNGGQISVQGIPSLVREGFISDNEYEIVCMGFPKHGLTGLPKDESSKRAALLNAYYYVQARFDETIKADVDGKVSKMEVADDHATVYYVISKSDLKSRLKK